MSPAAATALARVAEEAADGELHLPARTSSLESARRFAEDAAQAHGFDEDECFDFVFAVNEAVTNAIRHGAPDEHGHIHLRIASDAANLTFTVRDHGTFHVPGRTSGAAAEGGRGLAFIATLADELRVQATPDGTVIALSIGLPKRPPPEAAA
jgi:anti-sigma regulatory factor (Ser/Thr protein kinase)